MKVGEFDSIQSKPVDVWGADLTAEAPAIGEAEVIGDNDEEVWSCFWGHWS
jgi:hypothetical protein